MKQETHGRFTPSAWNLIKSLKLSEEENEKLRYMIDSKTETITEDEVQVIIEAIITESENIREKFLL